MRNSSLISTFLFVSAVGMINTMSFGAAYYSQNSWKGKQAAIYFYQKGAPFYCLTNFFHLNPQRGHKLIIDGQLWRSTEHYFQAQKFTNNRTIYNQIFGADSSRDAFDIARQNQQAIRADWHTPDQLGMAPKNKAMIKALWAKFTQNSDLQSQLLATHENALIEDSPTDTYWGCGANGDGQNQLGQMLMYIRYLLRNKLQPGPQNPYKPRGAGAYH